MPEILIPRQLTICQLADGHRVRLVRWNTTTRTMTVKSLRTGMTFSKNQLEVFELATPAPL